MQIALFGGIYNNHLALQAAIEDARRRGAEALYCLGDMGAFGPHPDRVFPLLRDHGVICIQGNYDHSIGNDLHDCQCGYTDPRDNYFAKLSYDYTYANTSLHNRRWMHDLPTQYHLEIDGLKLLLCHGSPRKMNEFLWESTTSTQFLHKLAADFDADVICATHTGIHWQRELADAKRFINVGVLGRPENDGHTNVWYTLLRIAGEVEQGSRQPPAGRRETPESNKISVEFIPLDYDHHRLAHEMQQERLPDEFIQTILEGWWTTCLEVLPSKERRRGRY